MNIIPTAGYVQFDIYSSDTIKPKLLPEVRRNIGIIFQDLSCLKIEQFMKFVFYS